MAPVVRKLRRRKEEAVGVLITARQFVTVHEQGMKERGWAKTVYPLSRFHLSARDPAYLYSGAPAYMPTPISRRRCERNVQVGTHSWMSFELARFPNELNV